MRRVVVAVVCLMTLFCRDERQQREGYDAAVRLGGEWLNCDRLSSPRCEVDLMYLAPALQGDARTKEEQRMRRGFRYLRDRFGGVLEVSPPTTDFDIEEIRWASADDHDFGPTAKATFPVKFVKLSKGYIQIEACKNETEWKICVVRYGLPSSNPSSAPMIASIKKDLDKESHSPGD